MHTISYSLSTDQNRKSEWEPDTDIQTNKVVQTGRSSPVIHGPEIVFDLHGTRAAIFNKQLSYIMDFF